MFNIYYAPRENIWMALFINSFSWGFPKGEAGTDSIAHAARKIEFGVHTANKMERALWKLPEKWASELQRQAQGHKKNKTKKVITEGRLHMLQNSHTREALCYQNGPFVFVWVTDVFSWKHLSVVRVGSLKTFAGLPRHRRVGTYGCCHWLLR